MPKKVVADLEKFTPEELHAKELADKDKEIERLRAEIIAANEAANQGPSAEFQRTQITQLDNERLTKYTEALLGATQYRSLLALPHESLTAMTENTAKLAQAMVDLQTQRGFD